MFCLSLAKLSEKNSLYVLFKHSIFANTVVDSWVFGCTFLKSIASWSGRGVYTAIWHYWIKLASYILLHIIAENFRIFLGIKLTQVPMHKWSLPKWRSFICIVSECQDVFRYNNFGNGFVHQILNQSCV